MKVLQKIVLFIGFLALINYTTPTFAGALQLVEQSAASLGNAFAGTAAVAEDASTSFYNPAGLTLLKYPEFSSQLTAIDIDLHADITSATANSLVGLPFGLPATPVHGFNTSEAGSWNFIPSLYFAFPCYHRAAFGLSVTAPFGLNTSYDTDSRVKYLATHTKLVVLDVSPAIAFQVHRQLSIGAGLDIQYAKLEVNQKVPVGESLPRIPFGGPYEDGNFENDMNNVGYGWNAGVLYEVSCATRIGFDYRSKVHHRLDGDAYIKLPTPLPSFPGNVNTKITFPDTLNLSFYSDVSREWAILGSINYTHWSVLDVVSLKYGGPITFNLESVDLPLQFEDSYRYAIGANYSPTEKWKLRGGVAYDESPVRNSHTRTFRVPDSDRYWVGAGVQYKISRCLVADVGYSHLFFKDASNNQTQVIQLVNGGVLTANGTGDFNIGVNEVGLQLTWIFI